MKKLTLIFTCAITLFNLFTAHAQSTTARKPATLNHIAVYVSDLEKSEHFYTTLLNLAKMEEPFKDGKHIWYSLGAAGQLHLIKGAQQSVTPNKNEHLCFSVSSITDFMKILDQEKVDYINWAGTAKEPTVRVDGVKQIYFQDPDGHWLEVNDQNKL